MRLATSTLTAKTIANIDKLTAALSLLDGGNHGKKTVAQLADLTPLVLHALLTKNYDEVNKALAPYGRFLDLDVNGTDLIITVLGAGADVPDLESYLVFGGGAELVPVSFDLVPVELADFEQLTEERHCEHCAAKLTELDTRLCSVCAALAAPKMEQFRPTESQFSAYQSMFDYFNQKLWAGRLPQVILNLSRMSKAHGFFAPSRWSGSAASTNSLLDVLEGRQTELMHEISLNPDTLSREPLAVISTLVHEMCHLERQITGKAPRGGYHDKQWAEMMLAVGLTPVSYDKPGTMLGQKVSHEIEAGGAFERAFNAMPTDFLLPFSHVAIVDKVKKKKKAASKTKYTCSGCESNIWGKPSLVVMCGDCSDDDDEPLRYIEEVKEEEEED